MTSVDVRKLKCPKTGKAAYLDEERANHIIELAWTAPDWRNDHGKMPIRAYLCSFCEYWHLTSVPERKT